jgi:(p)ppGpp synthase/HD superfamily hydrolase
MKYTPRLERAIQFAAQKHDGQLRIEKERLPYISHLISVAVLVSTHTDNEDCIIAALLHDVIEDTKTTVEDIETLFGSVVSNYVDAVTEKKKADWKQSKVSYVEQLKIAPEQALIIAAADKIHNILSRLSLVQSAGRAIFSQWRHTPEEYHWYHEAVFIVIKDRLQNSIVKDFEDALAEERSVFSV